MKERLNNSANCLEILFFRRDNILEGILFVPEALLELRGDMVLAISSLSVGCRNIVLLLSFERYLKNVYVNIFFCSFSY